MSRAFIGRLGILLAQCKTKSPNAHVGGGAIRDILLDRPIKDIDIFVGAKTAFGVKELLERKGCRLKHAVTAEYFVSDPNVLEAAEYAGWDYPINLISMTSEITMAENIERFDFGICRVAFDGITTVIPTSFELDAAAQHFTLRKCENEMQFGLSVNRHTRLQEKYVGWPMVVPDEFKKFDTHSDGNGLFGV